MEYKALYRKYRPDNFDSVVGQTTVVKTLKNIVQNNKISHAYLFSGPRGTGKTSLAKIFAKAINCSNPKDGMPCGECKICKQIMDDQTNDIIEIDAASNNGVDEIRDLKSKINLVPTMCKYKVYIIDEVHMLSIGAFNALLKTLEEPPHHVIFILATTEIHKLPLTIISRCQNFNFKKITEEQMTSRLKYIASQEQIQIDDNAVYEVSKIADGGMRDAIGMVEQLGSFTNNNITLKDVEILSSSVSRNDIAETIENVFHGNIENVFEKVAVFYQDGKDFIKIAEDIVIFLKDLLLYKKAKNYFKNICTYNIEDYSNLIYKLDQNLIYEYINEINKMIGDLKISTHPKIIFEIALLKLIDSKHLNANNNPEVKNEESKNNTIINEESVISHQKVVENNTNNDNESKFSIDNIDNKKSQKDIIFKEDDKNKVIENTKLLEEDIQEESNLEDILPSIKIPIYKKILINNTLAIAKKDLLADLKIKCNQLKTFLINKDFKQAATILLDGKIVGASEKNIIYSYPYDVMVDKADTMLDEIGLLMENIVGSRFTIVNITDETWQEVRPYYVKLMKEQQKIEILPEPDLKAINAKKKSGKKNKEIEDAINMFGEDLIEIK